jgi:hypothetical protein
MAGGIWSTRSIPEVTVVTLPTLSATLTFHSKHVLVERARSVTVTLPPETEGVSDVGLP